MVNVLEQAGGCSIVRRSEGKNRFFGNLWATFHSISVDFLEKTRNGDADLVGRKFGKHIGHGPRVRVRGSGEFGQPSNGRIGGTPRAPGGIGPSKRSSRRSGDGCASLRAEAPSGRGKKPSSL